MIHRGLKLWFGPICLRVELGVAWRDAKSLLDSWLKTDLDSPAPQERGRKSTVGRDRRIIVQISLARSWRAKQLEFWFRELLNFAGYTIRAQVHTTMSSYK